MVKDGEMQGEKRKMSEELKLVLKNLFEDKINQFEVDKVCCYWSIENCKWEFQFLPSKSKELSELEGSNADFTKSEGREMERLKSLYRSKCNAVMAENLSDYVWLLKMEIVFKICKEFDLANNVNKTIQQYRYSFSMFDSDSAKKLEEMYRVFARENQYLLEIDEMGSAV